MTAIHAVPLHEQQDTSSLAAARLRFVTAVSEGVEELMRTSGYSRERATAALLRELGRGDAPLENHEIFDTMTTYGLGVEDAAQALTVSRAVQRAMHDNGLSAVDAIDHLVSKLCITNLLSSFNDDEPSSTPVPPRPCSPEVRVPQSIHQRKGRKATTAKLVSKQKACKGNNSLKSRKRSIDESKQQFSSRARADSVSEVVEAKVAKKARISPEDSPSEDLPANPIVLRSKRHREDTTSQQSATHDV